MSEQPEREFRRLAARFQQLSEPRKPGERATGELAECIHRLMHHVRERDANGRDALWLLLWAALPDLVCFIAARVADRDQSEDLAQQVVTAVLGAYDRGSGLKLEYGAASFYEYLYTAVRREVGHHRRRPSETVEVLTAPEDLPSIGAGMDPTPGLPEFTAGTREFWQWVDQATRHLPQLVFDLVFLGERQGLTDAELGRVLGPPASTNISLYRKRAREKFIDGLAVLWVARTMAGVADGLPGRCTTLGARLGTWNARDPNSFTAVIYALVRDHIRGCALCCPVFVEFKTTQTGGRTISQSSNLLAKFRALPVAGPAPEALRRWMETQRTGDDRDRRRTLLEILTSLRFRRRAPAITDATDAAADLGTGSSTRLAASAAVVPHLSVGVPARLAVPGRLRQGMTARTQAVAAYLARQPGVSSVVQAAQNNPGLTRLVGLVVVAVIGAGALVASQPAPPSANALAPPPPSPVTTGPIRTPTTTGPDPTPTGPTTTATPPAHTPPAHTPPPSRPPVAGKAPTTSAGHPPPAIAASPSAEPACAPTWQTITSPNPGRHFNWLFGGAASGRNDVWAVGESYPPGTTITQHYDGSTWTPVPSPNPGSGESVLDDVVSLGPRDAWAAGGWYNAGGDWHALAVHWDGTAWTPVAVPGPGQFGTYLAGITALSPNDIWAVGEYYPSTDSSRSLALHWDGTAWTQLPTVSPIPTYNTLWGVSGTSPTDVWAVGGDEPPGLGDGLPEDDTLIEHWDGSRWTVVPSPHPSAATYTALFKVTAVTPTDAWATGYWRDSQGRYHALVMRWNGTTWNLVTLPDLGAGSSDLGGMVAFSPNDVWIVGNTGYTVTNPDGTFVPGTGTTLMLHWDGTNWTVIGTPAIPGGKFTDAVRTGDHELWALGAVSHPGGRWNDNLTTLTEQLHLCPG